MPQTYLRPNQRVIVLDTIQAAAADLSVVNGLIKFGNPLQNVCYFRDIYKATIQASVAEQLQVTTLTPVAADNSTYEIRIQQMNPATGITYTKVIPYTTPASGATATTISTFFKAAVNADPNLHIAATGVATIILTAETGYAGFVVTILQTGGGFTQATGTAAIYPVNTLATMTAQGFTGLGGTAYTSVNLWYHGTTGYDNLDNVTMNQNWVAYINQTGAYADLVTAFTEALGNLEIGAVTPSIENWALL